MSKRARWEATADAIVDALRANGGGCTRDELHAKLGALNQLPFAQFYGLLCNMVAQRVVERREGRYILPI